MTTHILAANRRTKTMQVSTPRPVGESKVVRARIDEKIKEEASIVLATMGLTVSDAFRMLLTRVARERALPFEPLVPNKKTIAAMRAARRGELTSVNNIEELLDNLNEED